MHHAVFTPGGAQETPAFQRRRGTHQALKEDILFRAFVHIEVGKISVDMITKLGNIHYADHVLTGAKECSVCLQLSEGNLFHAVVLRHLPNIDLSVPISASTKSRL